MNTYNKLIKRRENGNNNNNNNDNNDVINHIKYRSLPLISTKNKAVIDYVLSIPKNDYCTLFCPWVGALKVLEKDLKSYGIKTLCVTGKDCPRVRTQKLNDFTDPKSEIKIILLSTKIANVGLNLTKANHVIIFSPWWNPCVEEQAIGRSDRPGQTKTVYVIYFIMKGTMEEYVMHIASEKKNMTKKLFLSSEGPCRNDKDGINNSVDNSRLSGDMASKLFDERNRIISEIKTKEKPQNIDNYYILEYSIQNAILNEDFFI